MINCGSTEFIHERILMVLSGIKKFFFDMLSLKVNFLQLIKNKE